MELRYGKGASRRAVGLADRPEEIAGPALQARPPDYFASIFSALPFFLGFLGGAETISKASAPSLSLMLTSPPWTSLPNSNSSASGCLIFSWISRPIGRAP